MDGNIWLNPFFYKEDKGIGTLQKFYDVFQTDMLHLTDEVYVFLSNYLQAFYGVKREVRYETFRNQQSTKRTGSNVPEALVLPAAFLPFYPGGVAKYRSRIR